MRRAVSVWFPTLPTDRIRRRSGYPPEAVVVCARRDGNRQLLAGISAAASGLGLYSGMPLAQAQALAHGLLIHEADPDGDTATLQQLAGWCLRYAPYAGIDPPDGLWIDITGSKHLWGDEASLLLDLTRRLSSRGLSIRAAVADTPALAHAMAR